MWQKGQEYGDQTRIFSGSMEVLSKALGRDARNTRPLVESLIKKLSIAVAREVNFTTRQPRAYLVYDYAEIGARRRRAGLTWAVKNKGIELLTDSDAAALLAMETVSAPVNTIVSTGLSSADSTPVTRPLSTPPETSAPLYKRIKSIRNDERESSSSPLAAKALFDVTGRGDDAAIRTIANAVFANVPDATDAEIAAVILQDAPGIFRNRTLANPMGVLIRHIPRRFEGESFRLRRQAEQQRREADARAMAAWTEEAHAILTNPESSELDRSWAESVLKTIE